MNGVASWEPASDAEVALYDALAAGDQEGYFQTLARVNLLLPVSADAAAGRSPVGWGTWTANNHTHLLAFTSEQSMRTCLAQHVGGARRMSLRELAAVWPNDDWWLAVNPGLPIEGYLPAWFVAQLARGDARLPLRRSSMPRDRLERVEALERAKAAKAASPLREPIRTVATAHGPLALPPATAAPRWARGPSSIVDAEEIPDTLPQRSPARPAAQEREQAPVPPLSPAPARTPPQAPPPSARTTPPPAQPVRLREVPPVGPEPYRPPPSSHPARAREVTPVTPESYQPPPSSHPARAREVPPVTPEPYQPPPPLPSRTPQSANAGHQGAASVPAPGGQPMPPPERPTSLAEDRWAALTESRWAALAQDRIGPEYQHPQPERPAERRSFFEATRPAQAEEQVTQRLERRSLFDSARPAQAEEQLTQRLERRSLFDSARAARAEEQATQRLERRSLFEEVPAARPNEPEQPKQPEQLKQPEQPKQAEQPTVKVQRPVLPEAQPATEEEKKQPVRIEGPRHAEPEPDFVPSNAVEKQLYEAAEAGNTDLFLSTLLLATVLIPKASGTTNGKWRPQPIDGEPHIVSYTSTQHLAEPLETIPIKFIKLISDWPDPNWSFAVNPGTPVGATLPGGQLLALANWAAEVGLVGDDEEGDFDEPSVKHNGTPVAGRVSPEVPVLQKAIAPSQVGYYLERGYDRVTGFVHRAHEVGHLKSASQMRAALGLDFEGSPFSVEADEIYLLRWSAYRPNLYRIPYGGQSESAMHAMQGWVIERAPFRGNGFAPGETNEVIAEFKVDSTRLPHGARLLRLKDGAEELIAIFDADTQKWLRTDGGS